MFCSKQISARTQRAQTGRNVKCVSTESMWPKEEGVGEVC